LAMDGSFGCTSQKSALPTASLPESWGIA